MMLRRWRGMIVRLFEFSFPLNFFTFFNCSPGFYRFLKTDANVLKIDALVVALVSRLKHLRSRINGLTRF
jgi:hypothetical protein